MNIRIELDYKSNSDVGPLDEGEVQRFQTWLWGSGNDSIHFDESYIAHLKECHGGVPGKRYFSTAVGTSHSITRFLNFLPSRSGHPLEQYSVESTWSNLSDRLGTYLMPFADLFAGDMLCFDFCKPEKPSVVVWYHELSDVDHPFNEIVSNSFDDFLAILTAQPQSED